MFGKYLKIIKEVPFSDSEKVDSDLFLLAVDEKGNCYLRESFFQGATPSYHVIDKEGHSVKSVAFNDYYQPNIPSCDKVPQIPANGYFSNNFSISINEEEFRKNICKTLGNSKYKIHFIGRLTFEQDKDAYLVKYVDCKKGITKVGILESKPKKSGYVEFERLFVSDNINYFTSVIKPYSPKEQKIYLSVTGSPNKLIILEQLIK